MVVGCPVSLLLDSSRWPPLSPEDQAFAAEGTAPPTPDPGLPVVLFWCPYCSCQPESGCPLLASRSVLTDASCGNASQLSGWPALCDLETAPTLATLSSSSVSACLLAVSQMPLPPPLTLLEPSNSLFYEVLLSGAFSIRSSQPPRLEKPQS